MSASPTKLQRLLERIYSLSRAIRGEVAQASRTVKPGLKLNLQLAEDDADTVYSLARRSASMFRSDRWEQLARAMGRAHDAATSGSVNAGFDKTIKPRFLALQKLVQQATEEALKLADLEDE